MVAGLLLRGMIAGCMAGLLAAVFAMLAGEPSIERAIAFEMAMEPAAATLPEPELVSREVQRGAGLLSAGLIHGGAIGGLFGLAFAFAYGRVGRLEPRELSVLLAAAGFIAIALVPALKYPANPPAIGAAETLGMRTSLYLAMVLISGLGLVLAGLTRAVLGQWLGGWNASLAGAALFIATVAFAAFQLPPVEEIQDGFPAAVLWNFRLAALGTQAVMWSTLGLAFGSMVRAVPECRDTIATRSSR